jgi:hypothetical protein
MRSNTHYVLSMSAVVNSTGSTAEKIGASDIGFGLGLLRRAGTGVHTSGVDNKIVPADPTAATSGTTTARPVDMSSRYKFKSQLFLDFKRDHECSRIMMLFIRALPTD